MARKKGSGDKYLDCLVDTLAKAQGFGKTKIGAAKDEYARQIESNQELGMGLNDARTKAMGHVLDLLDQAKTAKHAKITATAEKISEADARFTEALGIRTAWFKGTPSDKIYHGLRTMVEDDPRMKTASHNFVAEADVAERNMWSMFRDVIDEFSKNWAGIRRGSVTDADIASEIFKPGSTGNKVAHDIAEAIRKTDKYAISEMNRHGVTIQYRDGEMPFSPIGAKLVDEAQFLADMKANIDWQRSGSGRFIRANERDDWLKAYFKAARNGDWAEMPKPFEHTGGQFALDFHNDRMIQFKDGQAYAAMHEKYMDGGFMQTNVHRIQKLAHDIGVVKIWGPSPIHTAKVFRAMAEKRAHDLTPVGSNPKKIDKYLRKYDLLVDVAMHRNAMDPESTLGMFVNNSANLMTSAMLTQASFLSIPGDLATMMATRFANNEPILRVLGAYLEAMVKIKASRREMLAAGHAASEFQTDMMINSRYGVGAQYGPAWTKYLADKSMRLNLMNRGFDAVRGADTRLRAMSLYEARGQAFKDLRERAMLERNGITEADWQRTVKSMEKTTYSPADDINMFRPLDHMDTLGSDLVHKWQRMFYNESRRTVIENTIEARVILARNTRPDSLNGAVSASFAKFHGYPVTFFLSMVRASLAADTRMGVVSTMARYGLLTTVAAAMGLQAKNYWQGKEYQDMRDPEFWMKASLSSGAFSMWGDFVTGGMRPDTATNIVKTIGGPFVQMAADATSLAIGSPFAAMDIGEHSGKWTLGKSGVEFVDFLRKYMIPETFFTAGVVQRNILEPLQERMSRQTMQRRYKGQKGFASDAGTPFKPGVGPGSRVPFPPFGG